MRIISKGLFLGVAAGFVVLNSSGIMPDPKSDHFQTIPRRNVFGLKEPDKLIISNPPPQLPKIMLTGITTILGNKLALLKVLPPALAGKAADAAKELSLILTEGQGEGGVEVLQIDERAGSVKVNNSGTIMTLTFEKDGPKLPSTPPGAGPGIGPLLPATAGGIPSPGVVAPGLAMTPVVPNTNLGIRSFPSRTPRWPETAGTAAVPPNSSPSVPTDLSQGLTPEEQSIVQQFQRAAQNQALTPPISASGTFQTPPH